MSNAYNSELHACMHSLRLAKFHSSLRIKKGEKEDVCSYKNIRLFSHTEIPK